MDSDTAHWTQHTVHHVQLYRPLTVPEATEKQTDRTLQPSEGCQMQTQNESQIIGILVVVIRLINFTVVSLGYNIPSYISCYIIECSIKILNHTHLAILSKRPLTLTDLSTFMMQESCVNQLKSDAYTGVSSGGRRIFFR